MKGMISIGDTRIAMSKVVYYQLLEDNKKTFEIYLEGQYCIKLCYENTADAKMNFGEFDKQMREFFNTNEKTCKENAEKLTQQPITNELVSEIKDFIGTDVQEAFRRGYNAKYKEMLKGAIEIEVQEDAGGYPYIDRHIELYDYDKDEKLAKRGDKVKVIIVKEG